MKATQMTSLVYLVVSVCLSGVCGRKFCCLPDKWHGIGEQMIGFSEPPANFIYIVTNVWCKIYHRCYDEKEGSANFTVDATLKAIYFEGQFHIKGTSYSYKNWQLYGQNVEFFVHDNECTRSPITDWSDTNHCIPDSAKEIRKFNLSGTGIPVIEYAMNKAMFNPTIVDTTLVDLITVTDGCIPVTDQIYGSVKNDEIKLPSYVMMFTSFGNIKPSIPDPSVFNVPDICKGALEIDTKIAENRSRNTFKLAIILNADQSPSISATDSHSRFLKMVTKVAYGAETLKPITRE